MRGSWSCVILVGQSTKTIDWGRLFVALLSTCALRFCAAGITTRKLTYGHWGSWCMRCWSVRTLSKSPNRRSWSRLSKRKYLFRATFSYQGRHVTSWTSVWRRIPMSAAPSKNWWITSSSARPRKRKSMIARCSCELNTKKIMDWYYPAAHYAHIHSAWLEISFLLSYAIHEDLLWAHRGKLDSQASCADLFDSRPLSLRIFGPGCTLQSFTESHLAQHQW